MIRNDFTFIPISGVIAFKNPVDMTRLGVIVDASSGVILYNPVDPLTKGILSGNNLSLQYNTSSLQSSDTIQVYYGATIDNAILQSNTISGIAVGNAIDSTGYEGISIQCSGLDNGNIYIETSHDQITWFVTNILTESNVSIQDSIRANGIYFVRSTGKYIRYNCNQLFGTVNILILGLSGTSPISGADAISYAMDTSNNMPLSVQLTQSFALDSSNRLILSDAPSVINYDSNNANTFSVIDTTGYGSVVFQQVTAGIVTPTISNDGINYVGVSGYLSSAPTIPLGATATAGIHIWPVLARYMKFTGPATRVTGTIYLRITPFFNAGMATVNAGVAGVMAIGGNIASGIAPTARPVLTAGIDTTALTRTILTDIAGRVNTDLYSLTQDQSTIKFLSSVYTNRNNGNALQVQEMSEDGNGMSIVQLLSRIFVELKLLNHQLNELPRKLNSGYFETEDMNMYRDDSSIFNEW